MPAGPGQSAAGIATPRAFAYASAMRFTFVAPALGLAAFTTATAVLAAPPGTRDEVSPAPRPTDVRDEVPVVRYAQSAFGASRMSAGALGYAGAMYGQPNPAGDPGAGKLVPLGGARLWG